MCFRIQGLDYMIIPFKEKISFQWIGHNDEVFFLKTEDLFCCPLANNVVLDRDWYIIEKINFWGY